MHHTSPGVERAVAGARVWADRLGSEPVRLAHFVLALLEEDEGRPAVLLEHIGLSVPQIRERLERTESPVAPDTSVLFNAARAWSITFRHDPEFLTDAFLISVLNAHPAFRAEVTTAGFGPERLERILTKTAPEVQEPDVQLAVFEVPSSTAEMDAGRVLDASFNRAREAARVLEDYCRFVLDDRFLTQQVKELRHGLASASQKLPQRTLLAARETLRDVGTTATAGSEYERASPAHVAFVNLKRLQESLRSLEEFGKVFGPELGRDLEALRYRTYTLERAISLGAVSRERLAAANLYVLLTRSQCVSALDWTIREAARGGANVFQLREKTLSDRELIECARNVRQWTRETGTLFIINDRPDIAKLCEADGVHLGQDDLCVKDARRIVGPDALIGVSTHSIEQLRQAVLDGADYIGIGPTFPSRTKTFDHFPGLEFVRAASAESSLPAFALGGISSTNIAEVVAVGAKRIAVSSAISTADEPEQAARLLKAALPD
ncbi:thiamine-phosphate pyrophosphorylase : Thiamine-phosphate synthase OS=Blastopirellula marina DSM 3645 GN=thiE PE=3 SV=1: Clp_N: TMP-TENI [Gemmata massiliana]|uniref:Thiamine-phosphate synthase n=1 Tax=Gemmata massiliana TaxID=1210884 RepID=A0A6P2D592_9BACT|nr:thiamine phosphate synthase [Gemmata massiliana]VTR94642.1 thiamine-phosphate pyrophosphorylase : Thiamine-phosphate synthase OS=Blastopirellula marina DSM 3645 GN=thiE PE=3 SV=1: Clp_N: TMP-TENI [Gemmata massiliana]